MTTKQLFALGEKNNWQMSWAAWQTLIFAHCNMAVLDNDSGIGMTCETAINANRARDAFSACTVGPARTLLGAYPLAEDGPDIEMTRCEECGRKQTAGGRCENCSASLSL